MNTSSPTKVTSSHKNVDGVIRHLEHPYGDPSTKRQLCRGSCGHFFWPSYPELYRTSPASLQKDSVPRASPRLPTIWRISRGCTDAECTLTPSLSWSPIHLSISWQTSEKFIWSITLRAQILLCWFNVMWSFKNSSKVQLFFSMFPWMLATNLHWKALHNDHSGSCVDLCTYFLATE